VRVSEKPAAGMLAFAPKDTTGASKEKRLLADVPTTPPTLTTYAESTPPPTPFAAVLHVSEVPDDQDVVAQTLAAAPTATEGVGLNATKLSPETVTTAPPVAGRFRNAPDATGASNVREADVKVPTKVLRVIAGSMTRDLVPIRTESATRHATVVGFVQLVVSQVRADGVIAAVPV